MPKIHNPDDIRNGTEDTLTEGEPILLVDAPASDEDRAIELMNTAHDCLKQAQTLIARRSMSTAFDLDSAVERITETIERFRRELKD